MAEAAGAAGQPPAEEPLHEAGDGPPKEVPPAVDTPEMPAADAAASPRRGEQVLLAGKDAEIQRLQEKLEAAQRDKVMYLEDHPHLQDTARSLPLTDSFAADGGASPPHAPTSAAPAPAAPPPTARELKLSPTALEVTVLQAKRLVGVSRKGVSNPYAVVTVTTSGSDASMTERVKTIQKTTHPRWGQRLHFPIPANRAVDIRVTVFSEESALLTSGVTFLGEARVAVADPSEVLLAPSQLYYPLAPREGNTKDADFAAKKGHAAAPHLGEVELLLRAQCAASTKLPAGADPAHFTPRNVEITVVGVTDLKLGKAQKPQVYAETTATGVVGGDTARATGMMNPLATSKAMQERVWDDRFTYMLARRHVAGDSDDTVATAMSSLHDRVTFQVAVKMSGVPEPVGRAELVMDAAAVRETLLYPRKRKLVLGVDGQGQDGALTKIKALTGIGSHGMLFLVVRSSLSKARLKNDTDVGRPGGAADDSDSGSETTVPTESDDPRIPFSPKRGREKSSEQRAASLGSWSSFSSSTAESEASVAASPVAQQGGPPAALSPLLSPALGGVIGRAAASALPSAARGRGHNAPPAAAEPAKKTRLFAAVPRFLRPPRVGIRHVEAAPDFGLVPPPASVPATPIEASKADVNASKSTLDASRAMNLDASKAVLDASKGSNVDGPPKESIVKEEDEVGGLGEAVPKDGADGSKADLKATKTSQDDPGTSKADGDVSSAPLGAEAGAEAPKEASAAAGLDALLGEGTALAIGRDAARTSLASNVTQSWNAIEDVAPLRPPQGAGRGGMPPPDFSPQRWRAAREQPRRRVAPGVFDTIVYHTEKGPVGAHNTARQFADLPL